MTMLKELREYRAYSTRELAELSGISHVTINRIESGKRHPHPKTARALAEALGVSPAELLGRSKPTVSHE
jgi:transcriptional regulator with XRE-family HTH domain